MQSIKTVFRIGNGPSSSHTMGPNRIAQYVLEKYGAGDYKVELLGSLALTGEGHLTHQAIKEVLGEQTEVIFNKTFKGIDHPNTLRVYRKGTNDVLLTGVSIGGGNIEIDGVNMDVASEVYKEKNFDEIKAYCNKKHITLYDYIKENEPDLDIYLLKIWLTMKDCVKRGLSAEGMLPGPLNIHRKAKILIEDSDTTGLQFIGVDKMISAYALAVAEENASGHVVVTAPTCGSCGVLPAVLYSLEHDAEEDEDVIIKALAVAGLFGLIIKTNASVAGAECGCQAEIGSACAMTAAALTSVATDNINIIESAAEIGLEHNLGLTCDPILGLVMIPCIERNAMAAIKAINATALAMSLGEIHKITFDQIVQTMYETGKDMNAGYRETSQSGLAKLYKSVENKTSSD